MQNLRSMEIQRLQVAADVMTRDVANASPRWTLAQLERVLCAKEVSGCPAVDGQTLVGVEDAELNPCARKSDSLGGE